MNNLDDILNDLGLKDMTCNKLLNIKEDKQTKVDMQEFKRLYKDNPAAFCEDVLNFKSENFQEDILLSVRDNKRTAVRSGQGVGKTAVVSCLIIWYLCTRENAKIIATAPSMNQIFTVLWSELSKWLDGSFVEQFLTQTKSKLYMNGHEKIWFAQAKTATTKEGMAGLHADNMLIICDEASGIIDDILETLQGTISGEDNRLLYLSNPTKLTGVFYDAFHANRDKFNCIRVNSENAKRVSKENIEMLANYGRDSNIYKVRVLGEFPTDEDDVFINLSLLEDAVNIESDYMTNNVIDSSKINRVTIGVDVSRFGDDETVISPKLNNSLVQQIIRRKQSTTKTANDIILICKQIRDKYSYNSHIVIVIDDTGVGGGVTDTLLDNINKLNLSKTHVLPINFAQSAKHKYYYDMTTAVWGYVRELLGFNADGERNKCIVKLPNDNKLLAQFSTRKFTVTTGGKIQVTPKKKMKQDGIKSPDRADAAAMACYPINWQSLENKKSGGNVGCV